LTAGVGHGVGWFLCFGWTFKWYRLGGLVG
jgi:hypothetical protein